MAAFIEHECEVESDCENGLELVQSETQSDKDFLDDAIIEQDVNDYRKLDRIIDMGPDKPPVYLKDFTPSEMAKDPYRKVGCKFCNKLISKSNLKKHEKICFTKHEFCTYQSKKPDGEMFECNTWILKKEFDTHVKNHTSIVCKWCNKRFKYEEYSDHEVEERLKELQRGGLERQMKKYRTEYDTNYIVWCKENGKQPKGIIPWLEGKLERKQIDEEFMKFAKEELKQKPKAKKRKPDETDKENADPENPGVPEKKKHKTCKSDDDDEESKKPSQNFQVTIHLKYTWIYTTIIKYMLTTFFDGYFIPSRFKKTWALGSGSTTLFPRPSSWRSMQCTALQKKTPIRKSLRSRVHAARIKLSRNSKTFDWEYIKLKYYDYNLNSKKYFRKRFIKPIPLIQEFISGKEYGLGAPLHCHFYIKTKEKMFINTLRRFFRRFKFLETSLLEHIGTLKSPRDWIKYVTKEDYNAVIRNVDKEKCNNNYIMWNFAKLSRNCNISMYSVYRWANTGQMNKYRDIHSAYWEPIIKREAYERAMQLLEPTERDDIEQIADFLLNSSKKGLYLYGEPKTGKSTTALAISKGAHYQVPEGNSTFAFHSWKNEPFILFEDIADTDFLHFRNKVNQLCDEHGLCFAQTKGGGSKLITCQKVIVTSNYDPPTEQTWPGFERRFFCLQYSRNRVTVEQINASQLYNIFILHSFMTIQINSSDVNIQSLDFSWHGIILPFFVNIILQKFFNKTIAKKNIVPIRPHGKGNFGTIHIVKNSPFNKFSFWPSILLHNSMNLSIFPLSPSSGSLSRSHILWEKTFLKIFPLTKKVHDNLVVPTNFSKIVRHYN